MCKFYQERDHNLRKREKSKPKNKKGNSIRRKSSVQNPTGVHNKDVDVHKTFKQNVTLTTGTLINVKRSNMYTNPNGRKGKKSKIKKKEK